MPPVDSDAKIPCPTPQHLIAELDAFSAILALGEREDTWEKLEKAVIRFAGVTRGGGYKHLALYVEGVGRTGVGMNVAACMLSDRGRLSGVTTELLQTLAPRLGQAFAPLVALYFDPLIRLLGRPNKVYLKRAEKCLQTIISHCQLPSILVELRRGLNDEAATCRRGCAIGFERTTREWEREVFGVKGVERLEDALRKMATDKDPEVRQISKRIWVRYNEVWPERVEDFSAPLTPTIKRYLDIRDAKNPGKSKAPSRPMPPPQAPLSHRPIATISSVSSSSVQQSHKPQHQRVHALTTKAARPNPPTLSQAAEAGPSRRVLSPAKKIEIPSIPALPASPPALTQAPPILSKSISSASLPPEVFALGRHGRSVSHNILSSRSLLESEDPSARQHNPLGKPSRPILPPSFSTTSLPSDPSSSAAKFPARRMAPPARILRPQQLDMTEEADPGDVDPQMLYATPGPNGVLRGATRPERGVGWPKRVLGKAERRVVTAPIPSLAKTPAAREPLLSRSVSDRIKETEIQPDAVPLPPSPSSNGRLGDSPELTKKITNDSPLLPVLVRSQTDRREGREMEMIDPDDGFLDEAEADLRLAMDTPLPREDNVELEVATKADEDGVVELATAVLPSSISANENAGEFPFPETHATAPARDAGKIETVSSQMATIVEAEPDHLPSTETGDAAHNPRVAEATSIAEPPQANVPIVTHEAPSNPRLLLTVPAVKGQSSQVQAVTKGINANVPKQPVQRSSKPPVQLKTSTTVKTAATLPKVDLPPATRKPPIPKVGRAVSVEGRRPFKPTSATSVTTASGSTKATDTRTSASTSDATIVTKVPAPTSAADNKVIAEATKTKDPASAASMPKPASKPPIPKAVPAKPTVKPTAPANTKAPVRHNQAKAQVTLPPVKTEKVKRKPPLPSFRPVSKTASTSTETSSSAAKPLAASTSSIASAAGRVGEHKEVVAKVKGMVAKVRPETIPLPPSPAERAKLSPAHVPPPQSPIASSPRPDEAKASDSPSLRQREFDSTATRFESKASTLPPASDYLDSESDDDALEGVTFKSRLAAEPRRKVLQLDGEQERDLIEFSAPSRPKVSATGTPVKMMGKGETPFKVVDREVLGLRDANTPRKEIRSGV
ncbi:clasp N terminal-domain-containing protein [Naematelia encephala]|uniref:Clasp N terminal-domain-containing protein n=1 Tax=Naematelia encephala TaxID=71784 RepID=A0A1Y2BL37_9TREE|nr:clasp N terminal-domain-containing protein [Naematelia encephala]